MAAVRLALLAFLVCLELLLAARLSVALARAVASGRAAKVLPLLRRLLRGCGRESDSAGLDADPDARGKAEALLQERTARFTRTLIFAAAVVFFLRTFAVIVEAALGGFAAAFNDRAFVIIAWGQSSCTLGSCCPWLVRPRNLWVWHWVLMTTLIAWMSPWGLGALAFESPLYVMMIHMFSLVFSLVGTRASPAVLSNALLVASILMNVAQLEEREYVRGTIISECVGYAAKVALIFSIHSMMRHSAQQEVLVSMQSCHRLAMSSLLDLICDAVVDRDDDLLMTEHCSKLGNMLMHRPGRDLAGSALSEFTAEDVGRESFQDHIRRNTHGQDGVPLAGMFGGHMRDSIGNRLGVVFFHAPYTTVAGGTRHLIGIQEKDIEAALGAAARCSEDAPGRALPEAELRDGFAPQLGARRHSPGSTRSSSSGASGKAMTVDVFATDGLPIRGADEAFRSSLGMDSRAASFLDALPEAGVGAELSAWIRERASQMERGELPVPHVETFAEDVAVGPGCRRRLRVLFPAPEAYCVSLRLERSRGSRGPTVGRGTSASQDHQGFGPGEPLRMSL